MSYEKRTAAGWAIFDSCSWILETLSCLVQLHFLRLDPDLLPLPSAATAAVTAPAFLRLPAVAKRISNCHGRRLPASQNASGCDLLQLQSVTMTTGVATPA